MSSSTTNLGLTLPADGERLSLGVLNQNWQTLDTYAGTVNGKINTTNAQDMTNLNNVTNTGNYSYDKLSSAMSNAPSTGTYFSGTLIVKYYNANKVLQIFDASDGIVYTRHLWNGTWGAWTTVNPTPVIESHSDWLTSTEAGDSGTMLYVQKMGKLLILNLRTTGRVHTDSDTLANLPVGYRPITGIDVPCWINGNGIGVCRIQTDGVVRTWVIPSGTATSGRVYLYVAYLTA